MTKDRRLGKGLAALLGTPLDEETGGGVDTAGTHNTYRDNGRGESSVRSAHEDQSDNDSQGMAGNNDNPEQRDGGPLELCVYDIDNNPFQPRREFDPKEIESLADSLKSHQQLQPVLVRKVDNRYQLISGERRLRAAIHAGFTTVRAEIREADDRMVAELAIVENLQRKDLNAVEKAMSFRNYIEQHGCSQSELAKRLSVDRSTIANLMRLLELPEEVLGGIQDERLSAGHARALLPLGDEDQQCEIATRIIREGWSVRQTETFISDLIQEEESAEQGSTGAATKRKQQVTSPQIRSLEKQLRMDLGTKVEIKQTAKGKGKIVVHFTNPDEFDRIRNTIAGQSVNNEAAAA